MGSVGRGTDIRRAIERRVAAANALGGLATGSYLIALSETPEGETLAWYWGTTLVSSLALSTIGAILTVLLGRRYLRPLLTFLDDGRPATSRNRDVLVAVPRTITLLVYAGWTLAGLVISANVLRVGDELGAVEILVGNLLGGLIVGNISYLVAERQLREPYAVMFADAPPEDRPSFSSRRRLLLAWSLGSGIPLLGIALTPAIRDRGAELPAEVPIVILACAGLAVGAYLTASEAGALADPMSRVRHAMAQVRRGDLDTSVLVDSPGEVGQLQAGFNEMVGGLRQNRQLQDLFGRHVGEEVARRALSEGVRLGGERRDVSVLFVDLIGSSVLARERTPEDVVAVLNHFFTAVVETVAAEGGWVNDFEGDGALCVFGAPADLSDHAAAALRSAGRLKQRLDEMGIVAGIGVASGEVVAGNIGTETRYEYTVIGHPVNVAARLTDAAKRHPARVLASIGGDGWEPAGSLDLRGVGAVDVYAPATGSRAAPAPVRSPRTAP